MRGKNVGCNVASEAINGAWFRICKLLDDHARCAARGELAPGGCSVEVNPDSNVVEIEEIMAMATCTAHWRVGRDDHANPSRDYTRTETLRWSA